LAVLSDFFLTSNKNLKQMTANSKTNEGFKIVLAELALSSTIHGVSNIVKTKRLFIKLIWLFSMFISFGLCCFYTIQSINEYLEYNTLTDTKIFYENPAEFPTVTFCNLQGLAKNYTLEETLLLCVYNRGKNKFH